MSSVTMCDTCGNTARNPPTWMKVDIPTELLPSGVVGGGSGLKRTLDMCRECAERFGSMLTNVVFGRIEFEPPEDVPTELAWNCDANQHRWLGLPTCLDCGAVYAR